MANNIIAIALSNVNAKLAKAEERLTLAAGITQVKAAQQHHFEVASTKEALLEFIEAKPISVGRFQWECEGGDALCTSKLMPSALWTAFSSVFSKWASEEGYFQDQGMTPVEWMELLNGQEATGLNVMNASAGDGESDDATLEERTLFSQAVFVTALHIAHYKGGEFKWLISMTDENKGTSTHIIKTLGAWAIEQASNTTSKRMSQIYRDFADSEMCREWEAGLMHVDIALGIFKTWLHTPCDDGTNTSRHERIVTRVANRKYDDFMAALIGGDLKEIAKYGKPWELIMASPNCHQALGAFRSSREYRIDVLEHKVKLIEAAQQQKALSAALDAREAALNARMIALGLMEAPASAPAVEPTVEAPQPEAIQPVWTAPTKGIAGTNNMVSLNAKGLRH